MGGIRLASAQKSNVPRVALLIGVSEHEAPNDLSTPVKDVMLVRDALTARGFDCETVLQPTYNALEEVVDQFSRRVADAHIAILYFAGHAFEHAGVGSVLPIDFPFPATGSGIHHYGFPISKFEDSLLRCEGAGILILDACRVPLDDLEERRRWAQYAVETSRIRDLDDFLIVWSTSSGSAAWDGFESSLFAKSFSEHVLYHERHFEEIFSAIGREVQSGPHSQRSWYQSTLKNQYHFSDLPRYAVETSMLAPLPRNLGNLWLARNKTGKNVIASGQSRSVFEFSRRGMRIVPSQTAGKKSLAEWSESDLIVIDSSSKSLVHTKTNQILPLRDDPHGLRINSSGRFAALLYNSKIEIVELYGKRPRLKRRFVIDWDAYGAVFSAPNKVLVVGDSGNISIVDAQSCKLTQVATDNPYAEHLYDASVLENGNLAVVGAQGSIRIIRQLRGVPVPLPPIEPTRFSRPTVITDHPAHVMEFGIRYGNADFLFCDISPMNPVLAAGNTDGEVFFIDLRDGRLAGKLTVSSEQGSVQGLAFLSDGTFVVLGMDAVVRFAVPS